jgi:pimeloyl-ACP methyl ester carboxylesterase
MSKRSSYSLLLPAIVLFSAFALVFSSARQSRPPEPSASYSMGQGPTVVLVHGLGSKVEHWLPVARRLARTHRVVMAQLPGHGESAMTEQLTLERAAVALEGTLARETREPVTLVGHSVGGLVAARLALDRPRLVRALVLIETSLKPAMNERERLGMLDALDRDYRGLVRAAYASFGRDSAQGAKLAGEASALDPRMMKPWIRLALTADLSADAAELHMPIIAVLADRSWPRDESWTMTARALGYERVPQVEPVRLENCGHFVMLDRPSDVARIIARAAGGDSETVGAESPR